ncbi:MAG: TrbG/VirB9 family P-type conjugative transfer protein [Anaplasmataceae bacterium]|nr:TrbG/VirB9 family P-type conjugative transfer protein [Anaplasmataceae bacterium]
MNKKTLFLYLITIYCFPFLAFANDDIGQNEDQYIYEQEAISMAKNPHIKEIMYNPNAIHKYTGYYGVEAKIIFEKGEEIQNLSMGLSTGWQLNPVGNILYLKPISEDANTNVTIMTNKGRTYIFHFYAAESEDYFHDPNVPYETRFRYPNNNIIINKNYINGNNKIEKDLNFTDKNIPDIANCLKCNFQYVVSGYDAIKPIQIFDNGIFTYFKFKQDNTDLPAIFGVDSDGYEAIMNFRIKGDYVIVEEVRAKFTLRNGNNTVCVTNRNIPFFSAKKKRSYFN